MRVNPAEIIGQTEHHLIEISSGHYIHRDMVNGYSELSSAAKAAGFEIAIASGYRSFERQLAIWNGKFRGDKPVYDRNGGLINMSGLTDWQRVQAILIYSALPGASRHHWGTDIDVYDHKAISTDYQLQLIPSEYEQGGPFYPFANWLTENINQLGFFMPYQQDRGGVAVEPWHLSFHSTACQYQSELKNNPEILKEALNKSDIEGKTAIIKYIDDILNNYVFNITSLS